ncbi:MAG TPA: hypothetical protein VGU01_00835 [Sphingomicrobium sp.]|nr:hypothetical protein [Sphingomicrobium sp.]
MTSKTITALLLAAATIAIGACNKSVSSGGTASAETKNTASETSKDPIASAESAAPATLAHDATIMVADASGAMKTIRAGKNGWTCIPDDPHTPGPDPMCMDGNAAKWVQAMLGHKPPPNGAPGVMYMLEGGTDASNTDPYAQQPTSANDWIKTGPHIMIVGSKAMLAGYPSGAKPDTSAPYVMWAGTPYAHLMVPVTKS